MSYKVEQHREGCIGCGACASVCPDYWTMQSDGKSKIKGAKKMTDKPGYEYAEFASDEGVSCNTEAANACPVQVIKIIKTAAPAKKSSSKPKPAASKKKKV